MTATATGPLADLRILDLSRILSGPFATMTLADLGAEVLKIEQPGRGDDTRQWGPPFVESEAAYFLSVNRNKKSLAIDLKSEEGLNAVRALAATADVVVENFRPGTAARLGLGYEELSAQNPGLVYASISGYGQTGPESGRAGYDAIAQARSGIMSVTGEPDGSPVRVGVSSADLIAGTWAVIGILAALHERDKTGAGQWVDVSLLDGSVSWLTYVAGGWFASGETPQRYGSAHPTIAPYQAFPTSDGDLMIAVGNDSLWLRFADAIGRPELKDDPRFTTNPLRVTNRTVLIPMLSAVLATRTTEGWIGVLDAAGIPAGPIQTVEQALTDPQIVARGMVTSIERPGIGTVKSVSCPIHLSRTPVSVRLPPPLLGEHSEEILGGAGLAADLIARLKSEGVVH